MNYLDALRSVDVHERRLKRRFQYWQVGRRVSTFDPMATAIDWLDVYRAGSLSIVDFYATEAEVECGCGGLNIARGKAAISEYWRRRFTVRPVGALIAFLPADDGVAMTYQVPDGPVQTTLYFDSDGKVARSVCGPTGKAAS